MYTLTATDTFNQWFSGLADSVTRARLLKRLRKVAAGNLGDHEPVGEGVWELREFFGPGWRMYYVHEGSAIILMLGGGEKPTQRRDITRAKQLAKELKHEQDKRHDPPV